MNYSFICRNHGPKGQYDFDSYFALEICAPIQDGPPKYVMCPICHGEMKRNYKRDLSPVIYNAEGFSGDYHKTNPGRGRSWNKKEDLNALWSSYYGEKPPPPDSAGTYDGRPKR